MYQAFRKSLRSVFGSKPNSPLPAKSGAEDDDIFEAEVCAEQEIQEGQMKVVDIGDGSALLVKDKGEIHAVGTKCSHYGAPLVKGTLCNGRVRCPWHGACFSVKTGDIEDFPGMDSIPKYKVTISDGKVKVAGKKQDLVANRLVKPNLSSTLDDKQVYLIIGGGGAAAICAETLRQEGYQGRIIMATKETSPPYDRPKLSKALSTSADKICLRKKEFYNEFCIELLTDKEATSMNTAEKKVTFQDGSTTRYDKVLLATGGRPRTLDIPGADLQNIFFLRTPPDGNQIAEKAAEKNAVIIGASFIGLEVAAYLADKAASVTIVGRSEVPLKTVLGDKVGVAVKKILEDKGVKFIFSNPPSEFVGEAGLLTAISLQDGTKLPADLCILGVGVEPSTNYITGTDIQQSNGYITVNKRMETSASGVYAAGDIVKFPLFLADDAHINIQHWQMAGKHGRTAALSMVGCGEDIHSVPFFWTAISGKSIRFAGYADGHDDVIIHGNVDELKFVAYYTKLDRVVAVASMNFDPIVAQAAEMLHSGSIITKQEIMEDCDTWCKRLNAH